MATKKYLRKKLDGTEDWVTNPKDATGDYRKPAEVTHARLTIMGVLHTTLVEVSDAQQSKYIICRERINPLGVSCRDRSLAPIDRATHCHRRVAPAILALHYSAIAIMGAL